MKIYKKENVYVAAINRINRLFDEFENVLVGFSGGKDSVVIFNLVLEVAKKRNRLPVNVVFIDQETEWQGTIDLVKSIMSRPDVRPYWYQIPLRLFNATSQFKLWLDCWEPGKTWIRLKDPLSIKENKFGFDRFKGMFDKIIESIFPNETACYLSGVRTEESPVRYMGLTGTLTYKDITWGVVNNKALKHYTLYPIYDWTYKDVWKAIYDNKWDYNVVYNYFYQIGEPVFKMRVSNIHHETAINSLFVLQRFEPETYEKVCARLPGIHMAGNFGKDQFFCPKELPFMFMDWREYRDYLIENLIGPETQHIFTREFNRCDKYLNCLSEKQSTRAIRAQIDSLLTNDFEFTKWINFKSRPNDYPCFIQFFKGKRKYEDLPPDMKQHTKEEYYGKFKPAPNK